jgi:hypothetical protein
VIILKQNGRNCSSLPQGLVKEPFPNEKYSKIMQNSQNEINVAFRENECTKINKYSIYIVWVQFGQRSERVSDCCLTPNEQYHGKSKLIFNEIMMRSALY